ncbi:hypothetical protein AMK59_8778 [Oryctes borbonicus]|uniref:procollagen-proline 4-dioxygenase n=1 Tax=Oryctes borbonicus TaxID=1629725 RepID=A0A0T6AZY8_9SCAR|nr:hypothetical protein AMK59_8778 [Oryctes borbonicus]
MIYMRLDEENMTKKLGILLITLLCSNYAFSEVFTALADLEELLQTENFLISAMNSYITSQERKLWQLRKYFQEYTEQYQKASEDIQSYVANPVNAYLLVKKLTTDWKQVTELITTNVGEDVISNLSEYKDVLTFPSDEDLNGAAIALMRLQDTYRLDTASLANGEIQGVKYASELTAEDCFELGRQSYNVGDHYHTQLWMTEADDRLKREVNRTVDRSDILEYLAFSTFKLGNTVLALDLTNKLLELIPSHSRALGNKIYYEDEIAKTERRKRKGEDEVPEAPPEEYDEVSSMTMSPSTAPEKEARALYEALCRGDTTIPDTISIQLKCRYVDNGNPFLKIAPFKIEEAYTQPRIWIFHDVMYDTEISTIKQLAQPRFQRATVQNSRTGKLETAHYRISKSAWLKEREHRHIANVAQRVEDMTGLNMKTAEELQVVNYGIGGHYEPHFDFARKEEKNAFKDLGTGNRIATVLFYMSDVAQGGATVFPYLNVALWPKKGTAAFWFNLHSSGEGDKTTRHAACPVLAGSKWVSNKWIHEHEQEFRRPCGLTRPSPELTA